MRSYSRKKTGSGWRTKSVSPAVSAIAILGVAIVCALGSYFGPMLFNTSTAADPGTLQQALDKVKTRPSNLQGLSIEQCLNKEIDRVRNEQKLADLDEWQVKPIGGNYYLVGLSFEEVDGIVRKAEWRIDMNTGNIVPQTEFAGAICNR
ncbi:MAG TPA: hypothetical protein VJQ56_11065 [Blastocatellia bacterium]|nr:hypothetical protein [Blastocatellia bacterium]